MNLRSKLPFFLSKVITPTPEEQEPIYVEYLESNGNQHIDTGVEIRTNNYRKEITLSNVSAGAGSLSPYAVMGSQTVAGGGARNPYLALNTQNKLAVGYAVTAGGTSPYTFDNPTTGTSFVLERKENKFTFTNGTTTYNVDYTGDKDLSGYSEWIFALNIDYLKYSASVRVYGYRLFVDEVLIRDMRPCLHPVTRQPAMYDAVEKKYYFNMGTGEFKYGDIISDEPIWLEYLESNGNQYIDLEYVMTNMVGVRSEVVEQSTLTGSFNSVFGYLGNKGEQNSHPRYGYSYYQGGFMFTFNMTPVQFNPYDREKHFAVMYSNENYEQYAFVNDIAQNLNGTTFTDEEVAENTLSMYLFGRNVNGAFGNGFIGKIYGFRHYDHTGTLVIDVRPCLHPVTLKPAMYDVVRKKYFYNKGIGEFTYEQTFTILDYIESDGNQYIDTEYLADAKTTEFDFEFMQLNGNYAYAGLLGSRQITPGITHTYNFFLTNNGFQVRYDWGWTTNQVQLALEPNQKHKLSVKLNSISTWAYVYMDDVQVKDTVVASATRTTMPMFVGNFNNGGAPYFTYGGAPMRIYSLRITDTKILTRDYIPVRMNDGQFGLYDFITGQFYGNAGTGSFKGFIGDIQLGEYLQSTHAQYIDTEYHANQDTKISMVFQEDNSVGTGFAFLGARSALSGSQDSCVFWGAASGYWRDQYGGQDFTSTLQKETNKHSLIKDKNITYFDGNLFKTHNYTPFTGRYSVFLFAIHEAGAPMYHAQAKIYSYKCWDNGTPICDMIPAKLADGRVGMYDFVRKKLYENQGTGEFGYN